MSGAPVRQGTDLAQRPTGAANRGTQIHQGLRPVSRAVVGDQRTRQPPEFGLRARQRRLHRKQPRHDTLDIAVNHIGRATEGDGGHGGGGIGTDPRQGQQAGLRIRKHTAVIPRHRSGAGQQVARPGVVAEPCPGRHDVGIIRRRQITHRRPAGGEGLEIGRGVRSGGLLQHHLGQPDAIGVRRRCPRRRAPGQRPSMGVVPVQQGGAEGGGRHRSCIASPEAADYPG